MGACKNHTDRFHTQYETVAILKEALTQRECAVHVDFAENYVCHFFEEVSSAYYSKEQVTVHPSVVYYKADHGDLQHKSLVVLSD